MFRDLFPTIPQMKGLFKYLVLYVLKDQELHGYGIMQRISDLIGFGYTPSPGIIYPTLQLLEDMEYVYSEKRGRKTIYHITEKGEKELENKLDEIEEFLTRIGRFRKVFGEIGGDDIYLAIKRIVRNYPFLTDEVKKRIRDEVHRFKLNIDRILEGV